MADIWKYTPFNLQIFWYIHGPVHLQSLWGVWDFRFTRWCCRRFASPGCDTKSWGKQFPLFYAWGQAVFSDCLTTSTKALQSFKMLGSTRTRQCHTVEDLSMLSYALTTSWPSLLKLLYEICVFMFTSLSKPPLLDLHKFLY